MRISAGSEKLCEKSIKSSESGSCIKCGACTRACDFLTEFEMELHIYEHEKRSNHGLCMLCGECKRVCPVDIDGVRITSNIRRELEKTNQLDKIPYRAVISEKLDYRFKNYREGVKKVVFFPGCNLPSFLPETTEAVYRLLRDEFDAGIVFDCCSKPIAEIGMVEESRDYIKAMERKLEDKGVSELVTACPNCYYFLKDKIGIKVTSIYSKLADVPGFGNIALNDGKIHVFMPCPDKDSREMLSHIESLLGEGSENLRILENLQCCGLGGMAAAIDKTLPLKMVRQVKAASKGQVFTYCATCYGNFKRNGMDDTKHFLSEFMGVKESFPKGIKSVLNRAKYRFKKIR